MKRFLIAFCACVTSLWCFGQNSKVIIGTRTVLLRYHNQKDKLLLPIVSDKYPALKAALSDTALLDGQTVNDVLSNYSKCGCGTTGFSYEVVYLTEKVISIKIFNEGIGAYPSISQEWRTLSIVTGKPYLLQNDINIAGQNYIASRYKAIMLARIEQDKAEEEKAEVYQELNDSIKELTVDKIISRFVFSKSGVWFRTDPTLPHAVQALEPDREVFFSHAELKKYAKH